MTDVVWAREEELSMYSLTPTATRVVKKAFAMANARSEHPESTDH